MKVLVVLLLLVVILVSCRSLQGDSQYSGDHVIEKDGLAKLTAERAWCNINPYCVIERWWNSIWGRR